MVLKTIKGSVKKVGGCRRLLFGVSRKGAIDGYIINRVGMK